MKAFLFMRLLWQLYKAVWVYVPLALLTIFLIEWLINYSQADALIVSIGAGAGMLAVALFATWFVRLLRKPSTTFGSARFAKEADLRRAGLRQDRGLILGKKNGRFLRIQKPGHLLTVAPTRSGKGVGVVIPNLLTFPGSVVVNDIKGENYRITSRRRAQFGPVYAFAPFDDAVHSANFNPLDFVRVGSVNEVDDARLIAEMTIPTGPNGGDHWEREARSLVTGLILFIVHRLPAGRRNLGELRSLLMRSEDGFAAVVDEMMNDAHETVHRIANGLSQKDIKERSAVISTAQSYTEIFESPRLKAITRYSDFKFEDLRNGAVSVFIIIPPEYIGVYQPFLRLMAGIAITALTRQGPSPKCRTLFILDEMPVLGYMRPIEEGIGYLAGYGGILWNFVQDFSQLKNTYPKWQSFIANCAVRQAFNVQDMDAARYLSDMLGKETVRVTNSGRSGRGWLSLGLSALQVSKNESETPRALLTPDEILYLKPGLELLFIQHCRPVLAKKVCYFRDPYFKDQFQAWRQIDMPEETRGTEAVDAGFRPASQFDAERL